MAATDDPSTPFSNLDDIIARLESLGVDMTNRPKRIVESVPRENDGDPEERVIDLRSHVDLRAPSSEQPESAPLRADEIPPAIAAEAEVSEPTVAEAKSAETAPAQSLTPPPVPDVDDNRLPPLDLRPPRPIADVPPPGSSSRPKLEIVRPDGWTAAEIESLSSGKPPKTADPAGLRDAIAQAVPPTQLPLDQPLPRLASDPVDVARTEDELAHPKRTHGAAPGPLLEKKAFSIRDMALICLYAAVVLLTIAIAISLL